jgi:hypothetical protein
MNIYLIINIAQQLCNGCGNINNNIPEKYYSSSNLPFVFPFENSFPPFSPVNDSSQYVNNSYMFNSPNNYVEQNQNDKFSKNVKKNKKTKKNNNQKYKEKRPFDWICNRCNNLNYSFRTFCNICNLPKSQNIFFNSSTRNSK